MHYIEISSRNKFTKNKHSQTWDDQSSNFCFLFQQQHKSKESKIFQFRYHRQIVTSITIAAQIVATFLSSQPVSVNKTE